MDNYSYTLVLTVLFGYILGMGVSAVIESSDFEHMPVGSIVAKTESGWSLTAPNGYTQEIKDKNQLRPFLEIVK